MQLIIINTFPVYSERFLFILCAFPLFYATHSTSLQLCLLAHVVYWVGFAAPIYKNTATQNTHHVQLTPCSGVHTGSNCFLSAIKLRQSETERRPPRSDALEPAAWLSTRALAVFSPASTNRPEDPYTPGFCFCACEHTLRLIRGVLLKRGRGERER